MNIQQTPGFAPTAPLGGIPGAPSRVAAPAPAAPQAPADGVTLTQAPPAPQTITTPSGVSAQVLRSQQGLAYSAALPAGAGGMIPVGLLLQGATDGKTSQVQAVLADNPQVALPAGVGTDGRVYVQLEANAPLVSFDPVSLDFGLSSPMTVDASGTQSRQLQELVHADGSRTLIHDEKIQPGQNGAQTRSFTRIDAKNGQMTAAQVTQQEGGQPQQQGMSAAKIGMAVLTSGMSLLMPSGGGNGKTETALTATRNADGSIGLGGGSFMDHAKKSATGGLKFDSPLMNWWKGRNAPSVSVMPFSVTMAANPGAVFPGVVAALMAAQQQNVPQA